MSDNKIKETHMDAKTRILTLHLLNRIDKNPVYTQNLGLVAVGIENRRKLTAAGTAREKNKIPDKTPGSGSGRTHEKIHENS